MDIQPILAEQLLAVGGVALFVALVCKFLIKPRLRTFFGLPPGGSGEPEDPEAKAKYSWVMNLIAVGIGIVVALIAQAVLGSFQAADILQAVLNGLVGGLVGIAFSEVGTNSIRRFG